MDSDLFSLKRQLVARALGPECKEELEAALAIWGGGESELPEVLDILAGSWVHADGFTLLERELGGIQSPRHRRWHLGQRAGVFVVDRVEESGETEARDVVTEEPVRLTLEENLPTGSVIRGRFMALSGGSWIPLGHPDVFESCRVIQRMDLAREWLEGPRARLLEHHAKLRRAFLAQREQQPAFVQHFGASLVVFDDTAALQTALEGFLGWLHHSYQPPSLGGLTWGEDYENRLGSPALQVQVELAPNLANCSSVGVVFDALEGIHFLPDFQQFERAVENAGEPQDRLNAYLSDPGITALPFRLLDSTAGLQRALDLPGESLEALLQGAKPPAARLSPSLLPMPGD
jgi:hypothetical protein